jgi:hypothetical protein
MSQARSVVKPSSLTAQASVPPSADSAAQSMSCSGVSIQCRRAADLFLAVEQHGHPAGQRAGHLQQGPQPE